MAESILDKARKHGKKTADLVRWHAVGRRKTEEVEWLRHRQRVFAVLQSQKVELARMLAAEEHAEKSGRKQEPENEAAETAELLPKPQPVPADEKERLSKLKALVE